MFEITEIQYTAHYFFTLKSTVKIYCQLRILTYGGICSILYRAKFLRRFRQERHARIPWLMYLMQQCIQCLPHADIDIAYRLKQNTLTKFPRFIRAVNKTYPIRGIPSLQHNLHIILYIFVERKIMDQCITAFFSSSINCGISPRCECHRFPIPQKQLIYCLHKLLCKQVKSGALCIRGSIQLISLCRKPCFRRWLAERKGMECNDRLLKPHIIPLGTSIGIGKGEERIPIMPGRSSIFFLHEGFKYLIFQQTNFLLPSNTKSW